MYKLKFTILQQEILRLLCIKAGMAFNARRLAQHLDVSQTAIAKSLPALEKEKFVNVSKDSESGRLAIELNRSNPKVIDFKRTENLKLIYESGLAEYLKKSLPNAELLITGDYGRGNDIISSDITIAVINSKRKTVDTSKFSKILERKINLNFYESIGKIDNKILKEGVGL